MTFNEITVLNYTNKLSSNSQIIYQLVKTSAPSCLAFENFNSVFSVLILKVRDEIPESNKFLYDISRNEENAAKIVKGLYERKATPEDALYHVEELID